MKKILCMFLACTLLFCVSCDKKIKEEGEKPIVRVEDTRNLSLYDYTVANISSTDKEGRTVRTGDEKSKENAVGLFYHVWQGYHTKNYGHINDITKLLNENPDALYNMEDNEQAPMGEFYFWGEPLYGYYCAYDPYVLNRHVELFTMAGVDYLVYDLTNAVVYYQAIDAMFQVLQAYYDQGWDVPKVAFYTNSHSAQTIRSVYSYYYSKNLYIDLWYRMDKKPVIMGRRAELGIGANDAEILDFFDLKESQWPNGETALDLNNGFPWMEWDYPQNNYNGVMSVSLAQHQGAKMSEMGESNSGRGFDYFKYMNIDEKSALGLNFSGQWESVFKNNESSAKKVNNVFVTGFNEWQAIKKDDGNKVFFVDTFNEEYSRDVEMMKGGYEDNFYLQLADLTKKFKYTDAKHYIYSKKTIDINDETMSGFSNLATTYKDFEGDAIERNHIDAFGVNTYSGTNKRNDISKVYVTHDERNLYVRVDAVEDITNYNGTDKNWMNVMIKVDNDLKNSFAGFKYIVNRSPKQDGATSVEKSKGGYNWESTGSASYKIYGNSIVYSIPLSTLNLTVDNCRIEIKVADNIKSYDDIMDYYVSGDSAPIGRLAYSYGY